MEAFYLYVRAYKAGQVHWIEPGTPDDDAGIRYAGGRILAWAGPPRVAATEAQLAAAIQDAASRWGHPRAGLVVRRDSAYIMWIHQQTDWYISRQHLGSQQHLPPPCTFCGLLTGGWCDGVPAGQHDWGWHCRMPLCSVCKAMFHECRWCVAHTGIATELDPRVHLPFRASPHELPCTAVRRTMAGQRVDPADWPRGMAESVRMAADGIRANRGASA